MTIDDDDPAENILGPRPPLPPHDPRDYMFTMQTIVAARTWADHLPHPGEVWELDGKYYPVQRYSDDAVWLKAHGASLVPPEDDDLHMEFDRLLTGLQRVDNKREL